MEYRKDIDGLRAIAIIAVILFHGGFNVVPGGFIGVDIFFAISGYLITSIIYPKMQANTFSFGDFYLRRARRLLPASIFMIIVTVFIFALFYPPELFQQVIHSAIAALVFVANIFFWQSSGYFSSSMELQPLLHMWSLSVEEQFYFFMPIALILGLKYCKPFIFPALALGCAVSLVLAVYFAPDMLSFFSFYLLPTRFYEMGLGALLAIYLVRHPQCFNEQKYFRKIGIVCVLLPLFIYHKGLSFPSFYPLLPIIGTLLILADSSKEGLIHRILAAKPLVTIGLYSYSLYLWHWPVHVLMLWYLSELSSLYFNAIYLTVTLIIGYLSYTYIENPLRKPDFYRTLRGQIAMVSSVFVTCTCLVILTLNGNTSLLSMPNLVLTKYQHSLPEEPFRQTCTDYKRLHGQYKICTVASSPNADYSILVWGDSHGSSLLSAVSHLSDNYNVSAFNTSGCPSLLEIERTNATDCKAHNTFMMEYLSTHAHDYDLVINASAWHNYIELNLLSHPNAVDTLTSLQAGIAATTAFYKQHGINYVFINQLPKFDVDIPLFYFQHHQVIPTIPLSIFKQKSDTFMNIAADIPMFDFSDLMCDTTYCYAGNQEMLFFRDGHHISNPFGEYLATYIETAIYQQIQRGRSYD